MVLQGTNKNGGRGDLNYLNEARVEDVHQKPVHTGATRAVSCGIDAILVKEGEEYFVEPGPVVSEETVKFRNVTLNRYFVGRKDVEVIEFCLSQLLKLTAFVARCEAQYPNKPN